MSFVIVRIFGEVGNSLTKTKTGLVNRLKYFDISSGAYKETKNHLKTTASIGVLLTIVSSGGFRS